MSSTTDSPATTRTIGPGIAFALPWVLCVLFGFWQLTRYETTAGAGSQPPPLFPAASGLDPAVGQSTLLMFAHPRCPCTTASIAELNRLMAAVGERTRAHVVFLEPKGTQPSWVRTKLWSAATSLPGVRVIRDSAGQIATAFRVSTSGHVLLYGPGGELRFSGGITSSRGHEGDNPGRVALTSLILGRSTRIERTPTYGCCLAESAPRTEMHSAETRRP